MKIQTIVITTDNIKAIAATIGYVIIKITHNINIQRTVILAKNGFNFILISCYI